MQLESISLNPSAGANWALRWRLPRDQKLASACLVLLERSRVWLLVRCHQPSG